MLDLHRRIDAGPLVGVELLACFGAGGGEKCVVILCAFVELELYISIYYDDFFFFTASMV